jgi:replicative superfamily II helicase
MEMAIFREFGLRGIAPGRIVYLAPIKALCQQKVDEWKDRFFSVNVKVCEVTGDND